MGSWGKTRMSPLTSPALTCATKKRTHTRTYTYAHSFQEDGENSSWVEVKCLILNDVFKIFHFLGVHRSLNYEMLSICNDFVWYRTDSSVAFRVLSSSKPQSGALLLSFSYCP